jgi:hypothetical protein
MALLGKSNSEQYLSFLPYFNYFEMYVDNILIQLKDTYSQIIILIITLVSLINSYLTLIISNYKKQVLNKIFLKPTELHNKPTVTHVNRKFKLNKKSYKN